MEARVGGSETEAELRKQTSPHLPFPHPLHWPLHQAGLAEVGACGGHPRFRVLHSILRGRAFWASACRLCDLDCPFH